MKSLGVSLVWILLSGSLLTPIGFLPAFATNGSSTTISSSQTSSAFGQSITFTAVVSPSTAIGSVQFIDTSTNPSTTLGTSTISNGIATFSTSSLSVGNHNIIAKYLGDANDVPSSSTVLTQTVNPLSTATTTSLSSNATSIILGHSVTFTATVSPSTATGTVQLLVNSTISGSPVTISGGKAIFTTSSLPSGTDNIVAAYSGGNNFNPSNSNSVTVIVTNAASGGGQGNNNLSSDSNLGQLVSDFVHQRNALLKEQRNETLSIIHECHAEMKTASHVDRKQIRDECKLKLKESREKFKELQKQLKQEFEQLKDQFQSEIKQLQAQQEMDQKNETQNLNKEIGSLQGEIKQLHNQEKIDEKNKTQTFNQEISSLQGKNNNLGNGFVKHGENNNSQGKHNQKEKKHGDD